MYLRTMTVFFVSLHPPSTQQRFKINDYRKQLYDDIEKKKKLRRTKREKSEKKEGKEKKSSKKSKEEKEELEDDDSD
jgi:hypothetical protein